MEVLKDQKVKVIVESMDGSERYTFILNCPKIEIVNPSEFIFSSPFTLPKSAFSANRLNIDGMIAEELLAELSPKKKKEEKATLMVQVNAPEVTVTIPSSWKGGKLVIAVAPKEEKIPPVVTNWTADVQDQIQKMMEESMFKNPFSPPIHANFRCMPVNIPTESVNRFKTSVEKAKAIIENLDLRKTIGSHKHLADTHVEGESNIYVIQHRKIVKWLEELVELRKEKEEKEPPLCVISPDGNVHSAYPKCQTCKYWNTDGMITCCPRIDGTRGQEHWTPPTFGCSLHSSLEAEKVGP